MNKIIASCGLICTECSAFIATQNNDDELRKKTAEEWSKMFNADIKPDDIYCVGCLADEGTHFSHCSECEIRKCCLEKEITNCAFCDEFPCKKITEFFGFVPEAKKVLEDIKNSLNIII